MKRYCALFLAVIVILSVSVFSGAASLKVGDADFDLEITAEDARFALRLSIGLEPSVSDAVLLVCDADGDGELTSYDSRLILRSALKLEQLPAEYVDDSFAVPENPADGSGSEEPPVSPSYGVLEDNYDEYFDPSERYYPPYPEKSLQSDTFTITTYGNGHAVGMSQWGAASMAEKGMSYSEILGHFYQGVSLKKETAPELVYYPGEGYTNTVNLVARIVAMEIGGASDNVECLKAQAVAIYTNIKRYNYAPSRKSTVGYAASTTSRCSENCLKACSEAVGEYLEFDGRPIEAVYSALTAGRTCSSATVWGGTLSYLTGVDCMSDLNIDSLIKQHVYTASELRNMILSYDPSIELPEDKASWITIIETDGAVDGVRGYVTKMTVGSRTYEGWEVHNKFIYGIMGGLRSHAFTVEYTP
ncbi:MAG: hypothetical protein K6C36_00705 [Clostridia bacterium]|nr:hypothetical protein [Clostridia bacterium]